MVKLQEDFPGKNISNSSKSKNKFIFVVIALIISILGYLVFNSFYKEKVDRNSYVVLVNGNATLNSVPLKKEIKKQLVVGDTVRTIGNKTLAVLEWGDGSVTRLGGNTVVKIDDLHLSENLDKINISFELLKGKTWSNVISFLGEDSYFNETFRDNVAAVRGTIFNVDLENEYLYVVDHKVQFKDKEGKVTNVIENKPFSLLDFNFISLEKFISGIKDKEFDSLNRVIDEKLFKGLKKQIHKDLDNLIKIDPEILDKLSKLEKEDLYKQILSDYQKLNFVKPSDEILFSKKIELKNSLIKISDDSNKEKLVENTVYDFNNIIKDKQFEKIDIISEILGENNKLLKKLKENDKINLLDIPLELKSKLDELNLDFIEKTSSLKNINIGNELDKVDSLIKGGLDTLIKQ